MRYLSLPLAATLFILLLIVACPVRSEIVWAPEPICVNQVQKAQASGTTLAIYGIAPNGKSYPFTGPDQYNPDPIYTKICPAENAISDVVSSEKSYAGVITTICTLGGLEGNYSLKFTSEPQSYCLLPGLNVQWDNAEEWCTLSSCGMGTYLNNSNSDGSGDCCSAREMDSFYRYTNEDCNKVRKQGQYICYIPNNYKGMPYTVATEEGMWLDAGKMMGEVIYEGCGDEIATGSKREGIEYLAVSQGERRSGNQSPNQTMGKWVACTKKGFSDDNSKIRTVSGEDPLADETDLETNPEANLITRQFVCIDRLSGSKYSIAECAGSSSSVLNAHEIDGPAGGLVFSSGGSVELADNTTYFCTDSYTWSKDLDNYSLAGPGGLACNNARLPKLQYPSAGSNSDVAGAKLNASWTGNYCCGELDDYAKQYPASMEFGTGNEYYNDDDRLAGHYSAVSSGACFNSVPQANKSFVKIKDRQGNLLVLNELMVWHGTLQGCAINSDDALANKESSFENDGKVTETIKCAMPNRRDINKPYEGTFGRVIFPSSYGYSGAGNDFLLTLLDRPNPGNGGASKGTLVHDNEYCNIKREGPLGMNYFCSYKEVWQVDDSPDNEFRTHLSYIPWKDSSAQQAECCQESQCWNGTSCVDSVYDTLDLSNVSRMMNSRGDGFICKQGSWEWAYRKTNWDGSRSGYCFGNNQCLIEPSGYSKEDVYGPNHYAVDEVFEKAFPACINSGEYYLDHYCENGTWTSRTKYAALALYNMAADRDFTLYCDTYDKVLNNYNYVTPGELETVEARYFQPNPLSRCTSFGGESVPCANHVCVMVINPNSKSPKTYLATSINSRLNSSLSAGGRTVVYDFGDALGAGLQSCAARPGYSAGFDSPIDCGNGISYIPSKGVVIFLRQDKLSKEKSLSEILSGLFSSFIGSLVARMSAVSSFDYTVLDDMADGINAKCQNCTDNLANGEGGYNRDEVCGEFSNPRKVYDLSSLYAARVGEKRVFGFAEYEAKYTSEPIRFSGIMFEGFETDICSLIRQNTGTYKCEASGNKQYVFTIPTQHNFGVEPSFASLVDILPQEQWVFMTASTRLQNAKAK